MASSTRTRIVGIVVALAAGGALAYFLWPAPLAVELAVVAVQPMQVTIDEDGRTRVKQRYVVSAPLDGRLQRTALRAGDSVEAGETVVATIVPRRPEMLDARARAESEARVRVAESAHAEAQRQTAAARESLDLARHQFERARKLLASKSITTEEFESLEHRERIASETVRAAEFRERLTQFEIELAHAALQFTQPPLSDSPPSPDAKPAEKPDSQSSESGKATDQDQLRIRSPITGKVFRVAEESENSVRVGAPLIELGDPSDLEIEIDMLSSDAVRVRPGAKVWLEHWGGPRPLAARVRLVEPSGFTKVSALGVEEQRVYVIADLVSPMESRTSLGDSFRVEARVVEWESEEALVAPAGAIFRQGDQWVAFVKRQGRARRTPVEIGHHNGRQVEIRSGLVAGDRVVVHPNDRLQEGQRLP